MRFVFCLVRLQVFKVVPETGAPLAGVEAAAKTWDYG